MSRGDDGRCPACSGTGQVPCECGGRGCRRCILGFRRCPACNGSGSDVPFEVLFQSGFPPPRHVTVARNPGPGSLDCDGIILYDGPSLAEAERAKGLASPGYVVTIITPDW